MWPKKYKDYPEDEPLIHEQVFSGNGIVGCEMHERNGWGETYPQSKRKKSLFAQLLRHLFGKSGESDGP